MLGSSPAGYHLPPLTLHHSTLLLSCSALAVSGVVRFASVPPPGVQPRDRSDVFRARMILMPSRAGGTQALKADHMHVATMDCGSGQWMWSCLCQEALGRKCQGEAGGHEAPEGEAQGGPASLGFSVSGVKGSGAASSRLTSGASCLTGPQPVLSHPAGLAANGTEACHPSWGCSLSHPLMFV